MDMETCRAFNIDVTDYGGYVVVIQSISQPRVDFLLAFSNIIFVPRTMMETGKERERSMSSY